MFKLSHLKKSNLAYYADSVKIDSITLPFCLRHYVQNSLSYSGKETRPTLCKLTQAYNLASDLENQINISCYTKYKVYGLSLIYNTASFKFGPRNVARRAFIT
jgi:hypothetical protein